MTLEYFDYLNRFAALETTLDARGQWSFPHPWLTTFIADSQVESVVSTALGALKQEFDPGQILTPGYEIF